MEFRPDVPRYLQIAEAIRAELRGEGERIDSEHRLCARFEVSRPTIRQALDVLVQEGLLYRHAGRGTFSTPTGGERKLRVIGSIDDIIAMGDETWFRLLSREMTSVPGNIARVLRLAPGALAYRVVGVRHIDTGPFQHVTGFTPASVGAALPEADFSKTSLLGAIERQLGAPVRFMEQVVDAVLAPRVIAEQLEVPARTPLLLFERTYFAASGEPIEHALTYQVGRRYPYRLALSRAERRN
jgi:GntR family transcriptional regulator